MNQFTTYLRKYKVVGKVIFSAYPVMYVSGLGEVRAGEMVISESGILGQVVDLAADRVGVMLLSTREAGIGERVARMGEGVRLCLTPDVLGTRIGPMGLSDGLGNDGNDGLVVDHVPLGLDQRRAVVEPFLTGVRILDLLVPLALGQRELVLGQRKVEKSSLVRQIVTAHVKQGGVAIYAAIAKQEKELADLQAHFEKNGVADRLVLVASRAGETSGRIFLTPYTAMTVAEFFRDLGEKVLVVIDDLSIHAQHYRELSLLLRRFPGRSSYPGDIFYIHSRLLERAGCYVKGSITCLPIAEMVGATLNEYIPTNLMAMTDGHIYFDSTFFNQGWRPAINPLLSVTRVGHHTQSALGSSLSLLLARVLVQFEKLSTMVHFGGELGSRAQETIRLGVQLKAFFYQGSGELTPYSVSLVLAGLILGRLWTDWTGAHVGMATALLTQWYGADEAWHKEIDAMVARSATFEELIKQIGTNSTRFDELKRAVEERL